MNSKFKTKEELLLDLVANKIQKQVLDGLAHPDEQDSDNFRVLVMVRVQGFANPSRIPYRELEAYNRMEYISEIAQESDKK